MTKLLELVQKLTEVERREVEDFAEFLLTRRDETAAANSPDEQPIRYGSWFGCLAHVHPEMSDKEFKKLVEDERVREALE